MFDQFGQNRTTTVLVRPFFFSQKKIRHLRYFYCSLQSVDRFNLLIISFYPSGTEKDVKRTSVGAAIAKFLKPLYISGQEKFEDENTHSLTQVYHEDRKHLYRTGLNFCVAFVGK